MAGSLGLYCGWKDCGNQLPTGKEAVTYGLPEERGLNPPVHYCSDICALMSREQNYGTGMQNLRRCW